jgi:hypothetical protein
MNRIKAKNIRYTKEYNEKRKKSPGPDRRERSGRNGWDRPE